VRALLALTVVTLACSEPAEPEATHNAGPATSINKEPAELRSATESAGAGMAKPAAIPSTFHLDPDPEPSKPKKVARPREARPIELILRSTPPGATASIDGTAIGKTPAYWEGAADGRRRDVTFALPGYAVARYRFVPTRSGVVHGSLRRLAKADDGAR
jgi:hypothetical protein